MSRRERLERTISSVIGKIRERHRRRQTEKVCSDLEEKALLAQARRAIRRRYGRRRAKKILEMPQLMLPIPQEFDVRGVRGVVLFGEEIARYAVPDEEDEINKGDSPYRFKREIRLKYKSDPSRGIMIFINDSSPKYPSDSNEPSISYVGMEFFSTPGDQPSHSWPAHMPIVLARGRRTRIKKGSNQPIIAESIMIGVIPNMEIAQTNVIFPPPPRIDQFLYVTALKPVNS